MPDEFGRTTYHGRIRHLHTVTMLITPEGEHLRLISQIRLASIPNDTEAQVKGVRDGDKLTITAVDIGPDFED